MIKRYRRKKGYRHSLLTKKKISKGVRKYHRTKPHWMEYFSYRIPVLEHLLGK